MYCQTCGQQLVDGRCPSCGGVSPKVDAPGFMVNGTGPVSVSDADYVFKSKWVAFFLCLFLGYLGIHRFYVGKIGTGVLWLLTGGLCLIGALVDLICILTGSFTDRNQKALK